MRSLCTPKIGPTTTTAEAISLGASPKAKLPSPVVEVSVSNGLEQAQALMATTLPAKETSASQERKHHGIRNARQYRSSGFETLLRNHDIRGRQRALQGHQQRWTGWGR